MTIEETIKLLKMSGQAIWLKGFEKERRKAEEMAIKSLEAWKNLKNEITMLPFFNREEVINIIDKHLSEVSA